MNTGCWYSEPFPPGGAISAEGVRNQLGRPQLSLFEVLAREAIQNSWDARASMETVRFSVDGLELTSPETGAVSDLLADDIPTQRLPLQESLQADPLRLLVVSDRGTTGLGGPSRADAPFDEDTPRDFVAFIRNVGEPRDKELGAGTFGFGKTIFYLVSRAQTVIVYTRCLIGGDYQTRLIGCAIGDSFGVDSGEGQRPYTGRHWWGVPRDGVQEPLLDRDADAAAEVFGLTRFAPEDTGTSIIMLDPTFDDPTEDMRAIAWAITWHAWPKMVAAESGMEFAVSWEGTPIAVPDPTQTPPLDAFVAAYLGLGSGEPIECYRPEKLLGRLSLHRQIVRAQRPNYPSSFEPPITSPVHHVALMRAPHFVVRYYPGNPLAGDAAEYAGVFEADSEIDDAFAQAEPPTHDDWIAKQLTGRSRTFVNTTFARLNERLSSFARPATMEIVGEGGIPLGAASSQFATLVATAPESGGTSSPTSGAGDTGAGGGTTGRQSSRGRTEEVGEPEFGDFKGASAVFFAFRVRRASPGSSVSARAAVGVDETLQAERDSEAPAGAEQPRILGWVGPDDIVVETPTLPTDGRVGQIWKVAVSPAPDTVTAVSLRLEKAS